MRLSNQYAALLQYLAPQHALSRFAGWVAGCEYIPLKNYLIKWFIQRYGVNMEEAITANPNDYPCFNSFFIRTLKAGARPLAVGETTLVSPVDGVVSQVGSIQGGRLFQAKGAEFDLLALVGGKENIAQLFDRGEFSTLYLAPKDYHRVHMPLAGKLISMTHVPGQLFSVNPQTVDHVPNLFARNERVICLFETAVGPMAVILVGAMLVASIHTVWAGEITPVGAKAVRTWTYPDGYLTLEKGEELGYFKLGSTVILLFGEDSVAWREGLGDGSVVRMGEGVGSILSTDL